jgi:hypothetical protein
MLVGLHDSNQSTTAVSGAVVSRLHYGTGRISNPFIRFDLRCTSVFSQCAGLFLEVGWNPSTQSGR